MNLTIKDVLEVTNGKLINGNLFDTCVNFCKDTRTIKLGDTYIGIKGNNFDGNCFWEEAIKNGATTVIVQNQNFSNIDISNYKSTDIILVENTLEALGKIAQYKRECYGELFPVIGITGSVGKTSTKDIISNVISQEFRTLKTEGNNNNNIGLPFTILRLQNEEAAVIEMGMNHLGEITQLTNIAKPTISVITNIGTSHIGNLESRENILKAKLEILDGMKEKVLIINNDNDLLHEFYTKKHGDIKIYTYGIDNESDVCAEDIILNENKSEFICKIKNEKFRVIVPLGGIHFVYNALCAVLVGTLLGIDIDKIKKGIETFELTKKRMDISELTNGVKIINDSYNASFESMQASLRYLHGIEAKRKIAVLGDMFELGDFSEKLHRKVGEEVINNNIDILVCTGENSKFIVDEVKKNGMDENRIFYLKDKIEIVNFIKQIWKEGDIILFKASNGMKFFEIVENLKE